MGAAESSTPENNHWVTSAMVTIVHPKSDPPRDVADYISSAIGRRMPEAWGEGAVVRSSSVGTYIATDGEDRGDADVGVAAQDDIPDWNADPSPWSGELTEIANNLDDLAMHLHTSLLDDVAAKLRKIAARLPNH